MIEECDLRSEKRKSRRGFLGYLGAGLGGMVVGGIIFPGLIGLKENLSIAQFTPEFTLTIYGPEHFKNLSEEERATASPINNSILRVGFFAPWITSKVELYNYRDKIVEDLPECGNKNSFKKRRGTLMPRHVRDGSYTFAINSPEFRDVQLVTSRVDLLNNKEIFDKIMGEGKDYVEITKDTHRGDDFGFDIFKIPPPFEGNVPNQAEIKLKDDPVTYQVYGLAHLAGVDEKTFANYWNDGRNFSGIDDYMKVRKGIEKIVREEITLQSS